MAKIVAKVLGLSSMSDSTHFQGQAEYVELTHGESVANFDVAIGMLPATVNTAICTDVASACNATFGTSWSYADVVLLGGVSLIP